MECHTFSIVARCPETGMLGVAVSSAVPAVGALCIHVESGVGAVSTQSWVNPYLAIEALAGMRRGLAARTALEAALAADAGRDLRQIGVVDGIGESAAWTGRECTPWHGQIEGEGFAVQGNMLAGGEVLSAMAEAFRAGAGSSLARRLLAALEAGDAAGGDKRGRQSAALKVHHREAYALLDIRADEHPRPVEELRRILGIAEAQLLPFVEGMPKRQGVAGGLPAAVTEMLLKSPPDRPGGGGSRP